MSSLPYCDFDASIARLSERLRGMRKSEWTPTPRVKELLKFAEHLESTADMLAEHRWISLETSFDADPPSEIGLDGFPVEQESRLGSYSALKWELRQLAGVAREEAGSYPDSRARPEIAWTATAFLHLWYQAEKARPAMYDLSEPVLVLRDVFQNAGIPLSMSRVRGVLAEALNQFDASSWPAGMEDILVVRQ